MSQQLHNELRKEFQLERLILFSDAVFAIAITLLVIEIRIPEIDRDAEVVSDSLLLHKLGHLIPKFIGFLISFMLIGIYWSIHHRMFGFVTSYNRKLLFLNLAFLFFIALMPFSTGFYGEYAGPDLLRKQLKIPMTFYVLNYCCAGFMNYFLWCHIINPKNKVADPPVDVMTAKLAKMRSLVVPLVFFCMLPIAYLTNVVIAVYVPLFIPVILSILRKRISRRYKAPAGS